MAATGPRCIPVVAGARSTAATADFVLGSRLTGRARARQPGAGADRRRPPGGAAHSPPLRRALHRHVAVPRHPPRRAATVSACARKRYGWNLEMQMRVAAAGLRVMRGAGRPAPACGRRIQGLGQLADRRARRLGDRRHILQAGDRFAPIAASLGLRARLTAPELPLYHGSGRCIGCRRRPRCVATKNGRFGKMAAGRRHHG